MEMSILSINKFLLNIELLNSSDSGSGVARFADHVPNTLMGIPTASSTVFSLLTSPAKG